MFWFMVWVRNAFFYHLLWAFCHLLPLTDCNMFCWYYWGVSGSCLRWPSDVTVHSGTCFSSLGENALWDGWLNAERLQLLRVAEKWTVCVLACLEKLLLLGEQFTVCLTVLFAGAFIICLLPEIMPSDHVLFRLNIFFFQHVGTACALVQLR